VKERQDVVADLAHERHRVGGAPPRHQMRRSEPVALGIICLAGEERRKQMRNQGRVHLAVGIELEHDFGSVFERPAITGLHRSPDAEVAPVVEHDDARIAAFARDMIARRVGAAVVDNVNPVDLGADAADHGDDRVAAPEAGNYRGDARFGGNQARSGNSCSVQIFRFALNRLNFGQTFKHPRSPSATPSRSIKRAPASITYVMIGDR
jgi:hypothetical protein